MERQRWEESEKRREEKWISEKRKRSLLAAGRPCHLWLDCPQAVLLEILFPFLPVGASVLLLQTAHFQDLPRARFLAYVQTMKEHICYPFAAMFRSGISVPPLSFRHQPRVFFDAWPEPSGLEWFDADGNAAAPRPQDLPEERLWRAAARLLGIAPQRPGAFERFLRQDCGVTDTCCGNLSTVPATVWLFAAVCFCLPGHARTLKLVCTCVLTNFLVMLPLFWLLCFAPLLLPRAHRATPGQLSATCSPFSSGPCPSRFPRAMPHVLRMATACRLWRFVDDLCGQVLRGSPVALAYMVWSPSAYPRRSQACRTFRTKSRNIVSLQRVCPIVTRGCGRLRRCDVCQWLSFEMPGRVLLPGTLSRPLCLRRWSWGSNPLWRETHFEVKMYKTHQGRSTFGSCDVEKSARRCGAKCISKSKSTQHTSVRALLEVVMSKKCTSLWCEAYFQVNMYKTHRGQSTFFWSWDVKKVHVFVARSTFSSQHVKNTTCSDRFWTFRCRFMWQAQGFVHLVQFEQNMRVLSQCQLQPPLHYITPHYTTLHYTTLRHNYNYNHNCTTLHYINYITLYYITLH